ncbi:dystroglycan isoform X1 [Cephus cinctus]|uniref:Dystroglycan 1 n=1 Tax=Cephus cinctus TaxID=211228 RepID=A0AAJ7BZ44_CEPCN|nr:dystroglycan isoform X1 [Cephus cinctus]XP_015597985.1 dystroglycan isoform X1 [Cephus cinctus]XP_015597986.1 dystroglycan isoform X1 [Cephus cinctus]
MKPLILVISSLLLLSLTLGFTLQEDDLVFDDVGEESSSTVPHSHDDRHDHREDHPRNRDSKKRHVERLWGVPHIAIVSAGHVFKMKIPRLAFSGNVDHYEARGGLGKPLARWLYWDEAASTFLGVPSTKDIGQHFVNIKAYGRHGDVAKDGFAIQVIPEGRDQVAHKDGSTHCNEGEDQTILTILLDARYDSLKPFVKVDAIENLAGFLGLHTSAFSIHPHGAKDTPSTADSSVILAGPGNVKHRWNKHSSIIQWQVGCDGHLWRHQADLVKQLREQARDGTIAEVLQLPVLLWHIKTDSSSLLRSRRDIGSGDYGNTDDYEAYDEYDDYGDGQGEDDDENETITELPEEKLLHVYEANEPAEAEAEHPHRHHHGEESIDWKVEEIDEQEIVPRVLGGIQNSVPTATNQTTTMQPTTTPPPSSSLPQTTVTTTTTLLTLPITSIQEKPSATIIGTNTSAATTATPATTVIISTTTTTTKPTTMPPVTEPSKTDGTEEPTERTKRIDFELETVVPTTPPPKYTTTASPTVTTLPPSTTNAFGPDTERPGTNSTTVILSVTNEETTEQPTMPTVGVKTTVPVTTTVATTPTPSPVFTTPTSTARQPAMVPNTTTDTPRPTVTTTKMTTTMRPSTQSPVVTEKIEYGVHNFPPRQDRRLKKIPVTAGKPLSYVIPGDTFSDLEDGDTRKLNLSLYLQGSPLKPTHWLQFNRHTQEVYGLPLENDISTWDYELVAADSEGLTVSDRLDIHVQQHKLSRTVNHEFSIYLRLEKRSEYPTNVDWELQVVRRLAELYGDSDPSQITVRSIEMQQDQAIFTWTNDSLPRSSVCPKEQIDKLLDVLVANEDGDPSDVLKEILAPTIRVKRVVYQGIGQCEERKRPEPPKVPTEEPTENLPPMPRNQVDHINATVGQLLVFRVPDDTFFDHEDGSTRNMKMSLLNIDMTPISQNDWLQFDSKNQEFYGIPLHNNVGRKEYQLTVTDKDGASATDSLVVVVHPAPVMQYNVEFLMTLEIPYESFAQSAFQKRNFVEKLRDLFQDKDTNSIALDSIDKGSTIVIWHNRSLPTSFCPNEEITRLREVLVKDNRTLTDRVEEVMCPNFPVRQVTLTPMGICLGELTGIHSPDSHVPPLDDSTSVGASHDDYLITFVLPAIIIAAMLLLAGIIACVLYRRRRSGKMSVSEQDDERQSFRNKGIPVIFQDELDEKPDPGNKSPVILKEEKPPLPPPEYQKSEDGADVPMLQKENSEEPYQPPPPFATNRDNNRQNRPKPTPTYRKPPPYVPP